MIYDLKDSPFEGGFYVGKLMLPIEYPAKPPGVMMITPNGRFQPEKKICMSMSDYHPESWSPAWSISKVLIGLVSFMNSDEASTGCISTSDAMKRKLAKTSLIYNFDHIPYFRTIFQDVFKDLGISDELMNT